METRDVARLQWIEVQVVERLDRVPSEDELEGEQEQRSHAAIRFRGSSTKSMTITIAASLNAIATQNTAA